MRELGERVGMRAQSLYSYFSSKNEIYDAMFAQGNRAFIASVQATVDQYRDDGDAATAIERGMRAFFRFSRAALRCFPRFLPCCLVTRPPGSPHLHL